MKPSFKKLSQRIVGEGLTRLLSLSFVMILARTVGAQEFGRYSSALAYASLFGILVDFGTYSVIAREIACEPHKRITILSTSHLLKIGVTLAAFGALYLSLDALSVAADRRPLILYLGIVAFGYCLSDYFSSLLIGLEEMGWESVTKVTMRLFVIAPGIVALRDHGSLLLVAQAMAAGTLMSYLAGILITRYRFGRFPFQLDRMMLRAIVFSSIPILGSVVFIILYDVQDILILNYFHFPEAQIGYFAAATKFIDVLRVLPVLAVGVFLPSLSRLARTQMEEFWRKCGRLLMAMLVCSAGVALLSYISAPWGVRALYSPEFSPAVQYLRWLLAAYVLIGINYLLINVLIVLKKEKMMLAGSIMACLSNVAFAIVLLPRFGVVGACYAFLGSECVSFAALSGALLTVRSQRI